MAQRCFYTTANLNYRSEPSTSAPVLGTFDKDMMVFVDENDAESRSGSGYTWLGFTYGNDKVWVATQYLRDCDSTEEQSVPTTTTTGGGQASTGTQITPYNAAAIVPSSKLTEGLQTWMNKIPTWAYVAALFGLGFALYKIYKD